MAEPDATAAEEGAPIRAQGEARTGRRSRREEHPAFAAGIVNPTPFWEHAEIGLVSGCN